MHLEKLSVSREQGRRIGLCILTDISERLTTLDFSEVEVLTISFLSELLTDIVKQGKYSRIEFENISDSDLDLISVVKQGIFIDIWATPL